MDITVTGVVVKIHSGGYSTHSGLETQVLLVMEKLIPECLLRLVVSVILFFFFLSFFLINK